MMRVLAFALCLLLASPAAAEGAVYKALVIYSEKQGAPEKRQIFGRFKSLQDCFIHAQARVQAMILRKQLYGGYGYCLYFEKEGAKPILLK